VWRQRIALSAARCSNQLKVTGSGFPVDGRGFHALFFDSGMRLNELVNIEAGDINWDDYIVTIWG
jgi:site-specific recombinase XerC